MKTKTQEMFNLSCPYGNENQGLRHRMLFVCSAGMLRSATAQVVATKLGYNARACGSENYALIPISVNLINWAETIYFVNEYNYLGAREHFKDDDDTYMQLERKSIVWDIEDIWNYMDAGLVATINHLLD